MTKKGYFPYWMREPIPEEYRLKWVSKEDVIKRLKNDERIIVNVDCWMKRADWIYFEKDNYQTLRIRKVTFNSLEKAGTIKEYIIARNKFSAYSQNAVYIINPQFIATLKNMKNKKLVCKECGHLQELHAPYVNGKGWHCTKDLCSNWQMCKRPKKYKGLITLGGVRRFFPPDKVRPLKITL